MIRMKIAFALRLLNDFSGNSIKEKGFTFYINERIVHPVAKEDGIYIFLEPMEASTRVVIEHSNYYPCSVVVQKKLLNPEEPVADVRLYEKAGKRFSTSVGIYTGIYETDKKIPLEVYAMPLPKYPVLLS